jgi:hypothetical protein
MFLSVYPLIVAGQQLGKNSLVVARQRLSKKSLLSFLGNGSVKILPFITRQWLGRNVTVVTNTHATIEELLGASFSMLPVLYQGN